MALRPAAEPLVWVSLLVGLVALPLYLFASGDGAGGPRVLFAAAVLAGLAAFGFGSALLLAAYANAGMHPASVLAAALGALAGGLFAAVVAAGLYGGLRIFAFTVLLVAGAGVAAAPRVWQDARRSWAAAQAHGTTKEEGVERQ